MDCFGLLSVLPQFLSSDESDKRPVWYSLREADHGSFWMESYHNSLGTGTGLEPVTSGLWGRRAAICSIPHYMVLTALFHKTIYHVGQPFR